MMNAPLTSVSNALVFVSLGEIGGVPMHVVDGRELHAFLESRRQFADWIKARIDKYGFVENQDFALISQNCETKGRGGDRRSQDYIISLDMAKELSMVENNAKGREARRYFIDMERRALQQQAPPSPSITPDSTGPAALLAYLLGKTVPLGKAGRQLPIRALIEIAAGRRDATYPRHTEANDLLGRYGLRVKPALLLVANTDPGLARLLAGSPWAAGWRETLRQAPGAEHGSRRARFGHGQQSRCTAVPLHFALDATRPAAASAEPDAATTAAAPLPPEADAWIDRTATDMTARFAVRYRAHAIEQLKALATQTEAGLGATALIDKLRRWRHLAEPVLVPREDAALVRALLSQVAESSQRLEQALAAESA